MAWQKIYRIIIAVILCLLIVINLYLLTVRVVLRNPLPKIFGYAQLAVITGSMEPAVKAGDMIIIKEQKKYGLGDIVAYRTNNITVTHRIIEISDPYAVTKGDANNAPDKEILLSSIEGKMVLRIPGAGKMISMLWTPVGLAVSIAAAVVLLIIPGFIVQAVRRGDRCRYDKK